ncbi:MAG: glycosyltransferase [Candidatus Latescibacterota bacterium]|nr:MAG: glycosyltransferase [Candidatus Latescibacterota bacterium]
MNHTERSRGENLRRVVAVVSAIVTLYYLYWRVTSTFNQQALFFSWSLWIAECFGAITTFLFFFAVWRPRYREAPPAIPGRTVDVLVPTKNEPEAVLRKTLLACRDLRYPHRTLLLDDGNRPAVKKLCEELGCVYLARETHEHAKAGNVNFGLEHSTAEFVAIFDADHAPLPWFIDRLIGYFADEKLAFAQAPQEFYNIDSFQHRADHEKKYVWTEQGLFYNLIQPGRDRWEAAYFVGSCAIMRRAALDDVGGFATGSITEDMLTSVKIHAKGWKSAYHLEPLAYGIAAETIHPFHIQRRRWSLGGWQVFFTANPLFVRGLTFPQRLCYLGSLIYPIEGFQKLVFYVTPPIVLFTGVLPMQALDITYLMHFVPYYALALFAYNEMGRGYAGYLLLEQFSMGKFVTYLQSFFSLLLPRRLRQFKVTPKGERASAPHALLAPQIAVAGGSVLGIVFALWMLLAGRRGDEFIIAVNSLWALFNSGLALAIIVYARTKFEQRRGDFRLFDSVPVRVGWNDGGKPVRRGAVAEDATETGLSIVAAGEIPKNRDLSLEIELPRVTVRATGHVKHAKTAAAGNDVVGRFGVAVTGITGELDTLSRYLRESSVAKFLAEYSTRYRTYLDKRLAKEPEHRERASRLPAHLPASIAANGGRPALGAIRNVSDTGMLLASREELAAGDRVAVEIAFREDAETLRGIVVRVVERGSDEYPEWVAGVRFENTGVDAINRIVAVATALSTLR